MLRRLRPVRVRSRQGGDEKEEIEMAERKCSDEFDVIQRDKSGSRIPIRGGSSESAKRMAERVARRPETQAVTIRTHRHDQSC